MFLDYSENILNLNEKTSNLECKVHLYLYFQLYVYNAYGAVNYTWNIGM